MDKKIEQDKSRFEQIVKGRVKEGLKKYISQGEMIGRRGKTWVSIPIPKIDLPTFRYGHRQTGGVGQGQGEAGTPIERDGPGGDDGAGNIPGEHILEVEVPLEELAKMLGAELDLPNIEPKGKGELTVTRYKYTGISPTGPDSLKHFKRTYKQALRRQLIAGEYDHFNPKIVPYREDKKYRSRKTVYVPDCRAVIIYMMDVSGSMGDEQKAIVRQESFWINTWIKYQYRGIKIRYIIHDAEAYEVDEHTFFHTRENGGTRISSAYGLCAKIIDQDHKADEWNVYLFHFSDGDNWGGGDNKLSLELLEARLLPKVNLFCYGQVDSQYGSREFMRVLESHFGEAEQKLIISRIEKKDDIYKSIKEFLGKGK